MFKIKSPDGTNNLCAEQLKFLRINHNPPLSQRKLASLLQIEGYDVDNHFIRRVELGERFVTDIELKMLSDFFDVTLEFLIGKEK